MSRAHDTNPVRRRREQQGMLLIELADKCEVRPPKLSMIEHGYVPRLQTMIAIADALDTTADVLWPQEFDPA